jgi:hypothetical protein
MKLLMRSAPGQLRVKNLKGGSWNDDLRQSRVAEVDPWGARRNCARQGSVSISCSAIRHSYSYDAPDDSDMRLESRLSIPVCNVFQTPQESVIKLCLPADMYSNGER